VEGAALQDRTTLANKIRADVARESQSSVRVDVRNVTALPQELCDFVERFKRFRYAGPRRVELSDVQKINYFSIDLRGRKALRELKRTGQGYRLKLKLYPETYRPFAKVFAIHKDGSVAELAQLKGYVASQEDGSATLSLSTETTVNAVLLIDSARPIPSSIVSDTNLDVASFRRLDAAAGEGDWNVELFWFDPASVSSPEQTPRL
jgi:hypothetical protein